MSVNRSHIDVLRSADIRFRHPELFSSTSDAESHVRDKIAVHLHHVEPVDRWTLPRHANPTEEHDAKVSEYLAANGVEGIARAILMFGHFDDELKLAALPWPLVIRRNGTHNQTQIQLRTFAGSRARVNKKDLLHGYALNVSGRTTVAYESTRSLTSKKHDAIIEALSAISTGNFYLLPTNGQPTVDLRVGVIETTE